MPRAIDHIVVAVNDLDQTLRDYESLGFTVTPGGEHAHRGSHNALVTFQDGSYFELIAFRHEPPVKDNTWWDLLQAGEGLVDAAVISDDLPAELEQLAQAGFTVNGPRQGGRHRPDGIEIAWRNARVQIDDATRFPFLIDDLTPRELRVPDGETAVHPNGTAGIAGVTIAVPSVATAARRYETVFGPAIAGSTRFGVGDQFIEIVDTATASPEHTDRIASHGPGPVEVALRGTTTHTGLLPVDLAHGARFTVAG